MKPQPQHTLRETPADEMRVWLSALADGEARAVGPACKAWREDVESRKTWHAYQLIGDVMRSEDLARPAGRDADFLAALRTRLATEPVVLVPEVPAQRRRPWALPLTAAAGFVVVAGVLVVARLSQADAPQAELAQGAAPAGVLMVGNGAPRPITAGHGGVVLRDARLDEFVRAHQFARGGVAVAAPGGALRQVEMSVPATPAR